MADWGSIRVGKVRVRQLRMKMNVSAPSREFCPAGKVDDLCADQGKGCVGPYVYGDETPTARWSHGEEKNKRKRTLVQTTPHGEDPRDDTPIKYEQADDSLKDLFSAYWSIGTQENYAYGGHTIYLDSYNPAEEFQQLIRVGSTGKPEVSGRSTLYAPDRYYLHSGHHIHPNRHPVRRPGLACAMRDLEFPWTRLRTSWHL